MRRPVLSDSDLSWFCLDDYSPTKLCALRLLDWCYLLADRIYLRRQVDEPATRTPFELPPGFERLLNNFEAPSGYLRLDERHATATPSINLLSIGELFELGHAGAIQLFDGDMSQPFDLELGQSAVERGNKVMKVSIDLSATRTQLLRDFGRWLDNMQSFVPRATHRNYRSTVKAWAVEGYLPFYDLTLFADSKKARIPPKRMAKLLQLSDLDPLESLKVPRRSLKVFNEDTLRAMRLQVLEAAFPQMARDKSVEQGHKPPKG